MCRNCRFKIGDKVFVHIVSLFFFVLLPMAGMAADVETEPSWTLLVGYGVTHTSWEKSHVHVEAVDLVLRYEKPVIHSMGRSWYEGYHSLLIEAPVHLVLDPDFAPMYGLSFHGCWTSTAWDGIRPYLFAGGGPLYSEAEIDGMGAHFNGNYQVGIGFRIPMRDKRELHLEYRLHHISNGNSKEPNEPLNSSRLLVGLRF